MSVAHLLKQSSCALIKKVSHWGKLNGKNIHLKMSFCLIFSANIFISAAQ